MPSGPAVLRFNRGLPTSKQYGERLRLLVVQGADEGVCLSLLGDTIFLGREGCQISLNDSNISRRHAEINWRADHYELRDLGSSNGFLINGKKVPLSKLAPGDVIVIGTTVVEVCSAGQVKRSERKLLAAPKKRDSTQEAKVETNKGDISSEEELKKKRETDKKRLLIYAGLFLLVFSLYSGTKENTLREAAQLPAGEAEQAKKPGSKKKTDKEIKAAIAEFVPSYSVDTPQRKDADIFFRNGVREQRNRNYRRAFMAFETALTVDPTHDLAKIYLKSAKLEMVSEIRSTYRAGVQAHKALRYNEAKMHFGNILRYLEGENGGADLEKFIDRELLDGGKAKGKSKKEESIYDIFKQTKDALVEIDKAERRLQ